VVVTISLEGARVWAVGLLGPDSDRAAFAVSWPVDRELETLLGAGASGVGSARWRLERLGTVPAGVLDVLLTDLDQDGSDDIALLSVDGLRTFRFDGGDARPAALGGPFMLPTRVWPRTLAGRIGEDTAGLLVGTTAGHELRVDPASGAPSGIDRGGVPLRQNGDVVLPSTLWASWADGGPDLRVPREALEGAPDRLELPERVRDVARSAHGDEWVWVHPDGSLGGFAGGAAWHLPEERVGDRIVLAELEGGGRAELVTTAAAPFGEPDQLTIHRLEGNPPRLSVLFRRTLAGSVRALDLGDLDFDGRPDLLFIEESSSDEAVIWRLERSL
jgi:hypothetical protein